MLRHFAWLSTLFILLASFHLNVAANERDERMRLANKISALFVPAGEVTDSWLMRLHGSLVTDDEVRARFQHHIKNDKDHKHIGNIYYLALFKVMLGEDSFGKGLANPDLMTNKHPINPNLLSKLRRVHHDFLIENFDLVELRQIEIFGETTAGKKIFSVDGLSAHVASKMFSNFQDIKNWLANEAVRLTLQELVEQ